MTNKSKKEQYVTKQCIDLYKKLIEGNMLMKTSKKTDNNFVSFIEKQTDMQPVSISDLPYIEISGQNHVEIDGIQKILEYKEEG